MAKKDEKKEEATFTKEQLINSAKYKHRVDLLNALLNDNETYTSSEVDKKINDFMKGAV